MVFQHFFKEHLIVINKKYLHDSSYFDVIVDNPKEFIVLVKHNNWHIENIQWWDRVRIYIGSTIVYGGMRDPRDIEYFFAETDICQEFSVHAQIDEYIEIH